MIKFTLYKIVQIVTPFHLRRPRIIAWLKVYVSWLELILHELDALWQSSRIEARMTPQILFLEHLLNNRYGRNPWDILIDDGYALGPWIYLEGETATPQFYTDLSDSYLWSDSDGTEVDFVVEVPGVLEEEIAVIGATVQKYKLPGKYFVIQIID
ncbi:MAG: hypothetical protein WCL00_05185 [Bacteroidota bacterium]